MSLLGRLLGRRPQPAPPHAEAPPKTDFSERQVRVMLFRESDTSGKRLLFDSDQTKHQDPQTQTPVTGTDRLGEMIFGSVAMNVKGTSLKMHVLESPRRLMCAEVFRVTARRDRERAEPHPRISRDFLTMEKEDSGFYGEGSSPSSVGSYRDRDSTEDSFVFPPAPVQWRVCCHASNARTVRRSSLSETFSHADSHRSYLGSDSHSSTCESVSGASGVSRATHPRGKLGLAILISLPDDVATDTLRFLLEHAVLLEAALDRLRHAVQHICYDRHSLVTKMSDAADQAVKWLSDLVTGPRLQRPVWISLGGARNHKSRALADNFLHDFSFLLDTMDTKETYFFMSTLLTNVLTYHLGWVHTVSPYDASAHRRQNKVDYLDVYHPYNPLWAQLGELYGAIGTPPRVSKTIVYGKRNIILIQKILSVLSYFIRCGEIRRHTVETDSLSLDTFEHYLSGILKMDRAGLKVRKDDVISSTLPKENIEMKTFSSNDSRLKVHTRIMPVYSNRTGNGGTESGLKRTKSHSSKLQTLNGNMKTETYDLTGALTSNRFTTEYFSSEENLTTFFQESILSEFENENNFYIEADDKSEIDGKVSQKCKPSSSDRVVFVLGESDALVGLREKISDGHVRSGEPRIQETPESDESHVILDEKDPSNGANSETVYDSNRSNKCCPERSSCAHSKTKKHSGVKFEFDKYPKIVTNYMKSKNLELLDRHVIGKPGNLKVDGIEIDGTSNVVNPESNEKCSNCSLNNQILQTPCNASELEFTCDIPSTNGEIHYAHATPTVAQPAGEESHRSPKIFVKKKTENTLLVNGFHADDTSSGSQAKESTKNNTTDSKLNRVNRLEYVDLPMPSLTINNDLTLSDCGFCHSLMRGVSDHYIADMVLQGYANETKNWELEIKRDLMLQSHIAPGGAVCLFADIDERNVKIWGSESGCGIMSNLIATMLDTLLHMQKAKIPTLQCLMFLESKLRELCVRSKTMAELLLNTEFCSMNLLTKTLSLEPNDVPLLLAIASTHSPQVALKYGISFR